MHRMGEAHTMNTALIFRERLLAPSETFIVEQAKPLRRYRPILVGLRRTEPSLRHSLPEILLAPGDSFFDQCAASLYRRFPFGPEFFSRLRATHPSIVHAHFAVDAMQALPIVRKLDVPLVVSLHGFDVTATADALATSRSGRHFLRHRDTLFREAAAFICVSDFIRRAALDAGFPASKLHVHYTGIDCQRFSPSGLARDPKLILFVGRLVEKKGCEYLLRALAPIQRRDPDVHVEVIGDGPLREKLQTLARQLSLNVNFRGVQNPDEVLRSMSRTRILCNPSVTAPTGDMEGFGMVFAEAQAVGTPVVSFAHAAIPEAVSHGHTGLLAREGNTEELSVAMFTLLSDDALWNSMSSNAQRWVRRNFDIARQADRLESLYDECVTRRHRTNPQFARRQSLSLGDSTVSRA